MTTAKYDNQNLIDGPADFLIKDPAASPVTEDTHASTACTTTVLTMAASPITAGFRIGDAIKVGAAGTEVRRISALTATTITLESALTGAPAVDTAIIRVGVNVGYTDQGVKLSTKTTYTDRMADQALDAISTKPDKRESTIKLVLQEVFGVTAQMALGLPEAAITGSGGNLKIAVGNLTLTLQTFGVMALGTREDGKKVTVFASRVVNQGEAGIEFAKGKPSGFALDLKLLSDSTRPSGEESYVWEIHDDHQLDYLAS
jgi:hypothetical protein